jgi:hypothetical protein
MVVFAAAVNSLLIAICAFIASLLEAHAQTAPKDDR